MTEIPNDANSRLSKALEIDMVGQEPLLDRRESKRSQAPVEQCKVAKKKARLSRRDLDAAEFLDGLRLPPVELCRVVAALNVAIASKDETIAALNAVLAAKDETLRIFLAFK